MKNVLISSSLVFLSFCASQKENSNNDKYTISLENKKCIDKVKIKNNFSRKVFLVTWNNNDCDARMRTLIKKVDYKNDTITLNIWMENIDEIYAQIVTNNDQPYICKLFKKTHYFDEDFECTYFTKDKLSGENTELSAIINNWITEDKCNN